jgi:glycosyltransferase involved in cell wall biosynthesis
MNESRPRILAIMPAFNPSAQICVAKPLMRLYQSKLLRVKITLEYLVSPKNLEWADLIVFCRNTEPRYAWILNFILNRNAPFVYDIDDNFFEIPLNSEQGKYHRHPERLAMHNRYIRSADLVRVYSDPLLEKMKTLNANVEKVFGPIGWDLISPPRVHLRQEPVKLVYATSRFDDALATLFIPALKRALDQYGEKVEIHFWGARLKHLSGRYRFHYHPMVANYDKFLRRFSRAGFDIGLAPLEKDIFHRSKTNNKFREYGACGIAGIYSDVDVYSACVDNGETGLLVSNETDSWYQAIARLIENHDLREKIKKQALEHMRLHYPEKGFERVWWNQIQRVLEKKGKQSAPNTFLYENNETLLNAKTLPENQSRLLSFAMKTQNVIRKFRREGPQATFALLKWRLNDYWMAFKIHFRTLGH